MKRNWSASIMLMADRVAIFRKPAFLPRREDIIRVKSELSGKIEEFKVWSVTHDVQKRTIIIQVIEYRES